MCENFLKGAQLLYDRSDFHDFYSIKPFMCRMTLGLKYKLIILIFGGARHHFISDAYAQHMF